MTFKKNEKHKVENKLNVEDKKKDIPENKKVEPVLVEPVLVEPVLVEPVLVEPVLVEPVLVEPMSDEQKLNLLTNDLQYNGYFVLSNHEAKKIAESLIKNGKSSLLNEKWFLTKDERRKLCDFLSKKFNLK